MRAPVILLCCAGLASCTIEQKPIPPFNKSGELVVVTRPSQTTIYEGSQGQYTGFEYDLVQLFAQDLGVKPKFVIADQLKQIFPLLTKNQAHFAAAGLAITDARERLVKFGPSYQTVNEQVVYNNDGVRPETAEDLVGKKFEVVAGSSYVEKLKRLQTRLPGLQWIEIASGDTDSLLQDVADGKTDFTIADSQAVELARIYYPTLEGAFNLDPPARLAWAFPRNADPYLLKKADEFFSRIREDGTLQRLLDRYYGHLRRLERADVAGFVEKVNAVLPAYRPYFQEAEQITGIDWRLLAALGYQESHWDPLATSFTNVRGIMMLTEDAADALKVPNRLDAKASILGGARYFAGLKAALPTAQEPDRTWLAIAAYNLGLGHLAGARTFARQMKLDPDSWLDMKKVLPLMARPEFYSHLKAGRARGGEAVITAENVRTYYDILAKLEKPLALPLIQRATVTPG